MSARERAGRAFARFATDRVVRRPGLWRVFRRPMLRLFDRLAPVWDHGRDPDAFAPAEAALARVGTPRRALDLGTGTGSVALIVADRFPEAEVVGADLAPGMVEQARAKLTPELEGRVRFEEADAERLPYAEGWFDLITLGNMLPFFDELDRVLAPGGHVVFSWSRGSETPIYVASPTLERELASRGYTDFAEIAAGKGTAFVARKGSEE